MKKVLILLLIIPVLSFAGFLDLVQQQLDKSSSYLSAMLSYKEAEFNLSKSKNAFLPYVSTNQLSFSTDFENYTFSVPLSIKFQDIIGFDLTISNSWTYSSKNEKWNDGG